MEGKMLDKKELKEKELKHVSGGADDDYTMESIRAVIVNLINEKNKAFSPALTVGSSLNDLIVDLFIRKWMFNLDC